MMRLKINHRKCGISFTQTTNATSLKIATTWKGKSNKLHTFEKDTKLKRKQLCIWRWAAV